MYDMYHIPVPVCTGMYVAAAASDRGSEVRWDFFVVFLVLLFVPLHCCCSLAFEASV